MKYPKNIWNQLKNKSPKDFMSALEKDGALLDITRNAIFSYRYPDSRRITIHYHPNKSYGPKFIKGLLENIGWNEDDLRRLKLIK